MSIRAVYHRHGAKLQTLPQGVQPLRRSRTGELFLGIPRVFSAGRARYGVASCSLVQGTSIAVNHNRPSRSALQLNGPTPTSYMHPLRPGRRHFISHDEAAGLLRRKPPKVTWRGGHYPRAVFDELLAQPGCAGIRFYFGAKTDGSLAMVLVGITDTETDMTDGLIADGFFPCPPFCDATSALIR